MRESKYDAKEHIKQMSNTKFAHKVVEAYRNIQEARELLEVSKGNPNGNM